MRTDNATYRNESARDAMSDDDYAAAICYCRECDNARLLTESRIAWRY